MHENCYPSEPWNSQNHLANHVACWNSRRVVAVPCIESRRRRLRPRISVPVSVAFGDEVKCAVYSFGFDYAVNYQSVIVTWFMEDNYVAVGVVRVQVFRVDSLDNYDVANA